LVKMSKTMGLVNDGLVPVSYLTRLGIDNTVLWYSRGCNEKASRQALLTRRRRGRLNVGHVYCLEPLTAGRAWLPYEERQRELEGTACFNGIMRNS
jgi:hypothetical protein